MQAGDRGPVRWRAGEEGTSPAAAETSLCFTKQFTERFLTSPFLLYYSLSLQDCSVLISTRFHLDKERRIHCDLPGKLEEQPLQATERSWDKGLSPALFFL